VRSAVAADTARIRFEMDAAFVAGLSALRELPLTDEADSALAALDDHPMLDQLAAELLAAEGRVDFARRAVELGPPFDSLMVGGRQYQRQPGAPAGWSLFDEGAGDVATVSQPIWLIEALGGATTARASGRVAEAGLERYDCTVDLFAADELSSAGVAPLPEATVRDLRRLPLTVFVDAEPRLRRMDFEAGALRTRVELFDFGVPDRIIIDSTDVGAAPPRGDAVRLRSDAAAVDAVREAAAATLDQRTAAIAHVTSTPALARLIVGQPAQNVMKGQIDLDARAYLITEPSRTLFTDGTGGPPRGGPVWLLDLVRGVQGASRVDGEPAAAGVTHYTCTVDLLEADRLTPAGLGSPDVAAVRDLRTLGLDVWVGDGLIRKVTYSSPATESSVELSAFGEPAALDARA
jgi:hypothetical protein